MFAPARAGRPALNGSGAAPRKARAGARLAVKVDRHGIAATVPGSHLNKACDANSGDGRVRTDVQSAAGGGPAGRSYGRDAAYPDALADRGEPAIPPRPCLHSSPL